MKDYTKEQLENNGRPDLTAKELVDFCLDQLYKDKKHSLSDEVVKDYLTYEELIGTLLVARDSIEELDNLNNTPYEEEDE